MIVHDIRRRRFFSDEVVLIAYEYEECTLRNLVDCRKFWVPEGAKRVVKLPKSWALEKGDELKLKDILMEIKWKAVDIFPSIPANYFNI